MQHARASDCNFCKLTRRAGPPVAASFTSFTPLVYPHLPRLPSFTYLVYPSFSYQQCSFPSFTLVYRLQRLPACLVYRTYSASFTSRLPLSSLPFRPLPSFTVTASFSYRSFTEHKRPRYQAAFLVYRPRYPPRLVTVVKVPGLVTARLLSSSVRYRLVTGTQPRVAPPPPPEA